MSDDRTVRERMLAGDSYIADDPHLIADSVRAMGLTHRINTTDPTDRDTLRALFVELLTATHPLSAVVGSPAPA